MLYNRVPCRYYQQPPRGTTEVPKAKGNQSSVRINRDLELFLCLEQADVGKPQSIRVAIVIHSFNVSIYSLDCIVIHLEIEGLEVVTQKRGCRKLYSDRMRPLVTVGHHSYSAVLVTDPSAFP